MKLTKLFTLILFLMPIFKSLCMHDSDIYSTFKISSDTIETSYLLRKGIIEDKDNLKALYKKVASIPGGLARTESEITNEYISKILYNGINHGLIIVAELDGKLIGSMIKYKLEPKVFSHILTEGSIIVDPDFQGMGIGSNIISTFLKDIQEQHSEILRVEIIARETNPAIKLYEKLGFKKEGRFEGRIKGVGGKLEADIPMAWINPSFDKEKFSIC